LFAQTIDLYQADTLSFRGGAKEFLNKVKENQTEILQTYFSEKDTFITYKETVFDSVNVFFFKGKLCSITFNLRNADYYGNYQNFCDKNFKKNGKGSTTIYGDGSRIEINGYSKKKRRIRLYKKLNAKGKVSFVIHITTRNCPKY